MQDFSLYQSIPTHVKYLSTSSTTVGMTSSWDVNWGHACHVAPSPAADAFTRGSLGDPVTRFHMRVMTTSVERHEEMPTAEIIYGRVKWGL